MGNMLDRERYKVAIPQLENRIKTLEGSVEGLIVKNYAQNVTVPASNAKSIYFTGIDINGYEPIAIAKMKTSGQYTSYLSFYRWDFNDTKDTVNVYVRNSRGDDVSLSIEIAVVYLTTQARIKSVVSTGGGGGGGGSSDYNDLNNKPQINSVTLTGNNSSSSLGLADSVHTHVMDDITDLETVTQLRDGIMTALDKQKLDGIASGAEVNVQSDWNQATNTADDFIKNKPTIPSKTSDLNNDSGFISTETDPVFTASDAYGITSTDITAWNGKSSVSINKKTTTGTNIFDITIDGTTTQIYAPTSGGGGVTDYDQLSSRPQINSVTLTGNKAFSDLGLVDFFYPVGSYYETSDTTFDPNVSWGGTWSLEAEGLVHIGGGANYTVGDTGGEATHTLTTDEMPSHTHTQNQHRHEPPSTTYDAFMVFNYGAVSTGLGETRVSQATSGSRYAPTNSNSSFDASYASNTGYATATNQNTGGGDPHNNMQPYVVVNRWHRTA